MVHWKLYEKWGFNKAKKNGTYTSQKKFYNLRNARSCGMDFPIQTDETLEYNRPDITAIEKKSKKCPLIDPARPFDTRIEKQNAQIIVI